MKTQACNTAACTDSSTKDKASDPTQEPPSMIPVTSFGVTLTYSVRSKHSLGTGPTNEGNTTRAIEKAGLSLVPRMLAALQQQPGVMPATVNVAYWCWNTNCSSKLSTQPRSTSAVPVSLHEVSLAQTELSRSLSQTNGIT